VTPLLAERGHIVQTIDLPGLGDDQTPAGDVTADLWAETVADIARAAKSPVVLVGHSLGGTVIAQGAERAPDNVCGLIFVTALLLPAGETAASFCPELMTIAEETASRFPGNPAAAARQMFYGSSAPEIADAAIARLRPQPEAVATAAMVVSEGRFGRLPRAYVECADDFILPLFLQRRMQARLPCDPVVTMPGDHSPFLNDPATLAAHLDVIARGFAESCVV
jgi:pimeloyl-ACP methyl ester carboxylesterase